MDQTNGQGIVSRVRDKATAQLNSQKDRATEGLGTVASAVRESTQTLRNQQHDMAARYVEQAADQIERLTARLREKDAAELLRDAQRLARRRPALFVGAAFALGLFGARFMKSTARDGDDDFTATYGRGGRRESFAGDINTPPINTSQAAGWNAATDAAERY